MVAGVDWRSLHTFAKPEMVEGLLDDLGLSDVRLRAAARAAALEGLQGNAEVPVSLWHMAIEFYVLGYAKALDDMRGSMVRYYRG